MNDVRYVLEVKWQTGWVIRAAWRQLGDAMHNLEPITAVPARVVRYSNGLRQEVIAEGAMAEI